MNRLNTWYQMQTLSNAFGNTFGISGRQTGLSQRSHESHNIVSRGFIFGNVANGATTEEKDRLAAFGFGGTVLVMGAMLGQEVLVDGGLLAPVAFNPGVVGATGSFFVGYAVGGLMYHTFDVLHYENYTWATTLEEWWGR